MMEVELKGKGTDKTPGFKENFFQNEISLLDSNGNIHVRNLPYYFETYWQERPLVLNTSTDQLGSGDPDGTKPSRYGDSLGLHVKPGVSRGQSYYSEWDSGVPEKTNCSRNIKSASANSEKTNQSRNIMSATASRTQYMSSQKMSSHDTFLNYLVRNMGHKPEFQKNAKQFIVLENEPNLPSFVFPKDLHPKIFWRDVRQSSARIIPKHIRAESGQRKLLHSQNSKRTLRNMPASPAPSLASDKCTDSGTNKILKEHAGTGTSESQKNRRVRLRHSAGRKKKSKKRSKKTSSKKEKNRQNHLHDCKHFGTDSESSSEDEDNGNRYDGRFNSYKTNNKNMRPKKEKNFNPGQRNKRNEEIDEVHQVENEEEDENDEDELDGINSEEYLNFEFTKDLSSLPKFNPVSRMPQKLSVRKRSIVPSVKKNKIESEETTEPETRMFSSSKLMKTAKYNNKDNMQSWLQEQLDFSLKPCRFKLPVDSRELEETSPEEYLRTHCIVTSQFHSLYKNVFRKYQSPNMFQIEYKYLEIALRDVAVNSFTPEKLQLLGTLINLNETSAVDYKLFAGMAALAERLSDANIESIKNTESSQEGNMKRAEIEMADFSALEWKFKDIDINRNMKQLLSIIAF